MKMLKIICLLILFGFISIMYVTDLIGAENELSNKDAYILLDMLLELSPKDRSIKDELERQKNWMNVYNKYFQKKKLTPNEMKIYFFIIYIADEIAFTHSQEEFSKDVIIKFERQPELFLTILNSMPFMVPHVCRAIRDHYILTRNAKNGNEFINKYNSELGQFLDEKEKNICIKILKE